jgi:molecular chaperone GrpE
MSKTKMNQESRIKNQDEEKFFMARVTNKAFIFDPETQKFLFARAADMKEEYWKLIGGRMKDGEELGEALQREIIEEIGENVKYESAGTLGVTTVFEEGEAINIVAYLVLYRGGEIVLNEEHSEYRWFTFEEAMECKCIAQWAPPLLEEAKKRMKEQEYLNDLKRLQADFDNYKKRQQESQKELGGYLIEKLILDIVPVLDNFRAATSHVPPEQKDSSWVVGIQYIEKQLEDVVKSNGVEVIEVNEGDAFDPSLHEAVESQQSETNSETETEEKPHVVVKVLQKGFRLGGKVIRPAKVTVK